MKRVILVVVALAAFAFGREPGLAEYRAVQESLSRVHPRMRASWLREHGLDDSPYTTFRKPDSGSGLRCIGRWPWGPSWELCGRDSLLFLGSGSGVRILSISDSIHPRMLGQIVARSLVTQLVIRDTLLFVACGNWGAQIYSVSDPANPQELGSMNAVTLDLCVEDTLCFTVGGDSLRIYKVTDPHLPLQLSAARDSSELVVVSGTHVYAAYDGMNVYDISNPLSPSRVNTRGGQYLSLFIRDSLLFCSSVQPSYFAILDISDPLNIQQIGYISGYGGRALYVDDYFAYLSCTYEHEGIFVFDITSPANPQVRGSYDPEGSDNFDPYVPAPLSYGYLASEYGGLVAIDLHNPNTPAFASSDFQAHLAVDVHVDDSLAYVADYEAGLRILDISDPTRPTTIGIYDTTGMLDAQSAVARDSFAFTCYRGDQRRFLRILDVTDPSAPTFAAEESCFNMPQDLVLRDSLIYAAEANRFQIFNVARPREPVLVGSCVLPYDSYDMDVRDTLAFIGNVHSLQIVSEARPDSPRVVGTWPYHTLGVAVADTIAYTGSTDYYFSSLNVADPAAPILLDTLWLGNSQTDVALCGARAYVACNDEVICVDIADPMNLRIVGRWKGPAWIRRLSYAAPYVYVACSDAGVCICETLPVGIAESRPAPQRPCLLRLHPNPAGSFITLEVGSDDMPLDWVLRDVVGRVVRRGLMRPDGSSFKIALGDLPGGVYLISVGAKGGIRHTTAFVKQP